MIKAIGTFGKQWEADLAIALLKENALHPADLQTFSHATLAGAEQAYHVSVPEGEVQEAVALLKAHGHEQNVSTDR